MKVKVITPLASAQKALDEKGWIELPEGAVLKDLEKAIGLNGFMRKVFPAFLNGKHLSGSAELHDGDVVSFFSTALRGG